VKVIYKDYKGVICSFLIRKYVVSGSSYITSSQKRLGCGSMRLVDCTTGKLLASEVELADTFWRRFRGLMLRGKFSQGKALLFKFPKPGRRGVHMWFVRFSIDLVYLDSSFRVVELRAQLKPWRFHRPRAIVSYLIELPAGTISRARVQVGHEISLKGKR